MIVGEFRSAYLIGGADWDESWSGTGARGGGNVRGQEATQACCWASAGGESGDDGDEGVGANLAPKSLRWPPRCGVPGGRPWNYWGPACRAMSPGRWHLGPPCGR